ncbi:hypothetical protein BOTBODRAFT_190697 [Botryobasidium botryosum FD-172 SS1]|uniref:Uncharacterized protein n=1 Tax=Botryobasidium botryosum (strain FD-172 SS1) TaxID=930990 RepID=A0A067MDW9_BOTB1|nr:hypothetical protein BOTBODRAFT_190697 [Botryobasidium botryosum FD-172 SS1]
MSAAAVGPAPGFRLDRDRRRAESNLELARWFEGLSPAVVRGGKFPFEALPVTVLCFNRERKYMFLYERQDSMQHVYSATIRGCVVASVRVDISLTKSGVVQREHVLHAMTYAARQGIHVVLGSTPPSTGHMATHPWKRPVYMTGGARQDGSEIRISLPTLEDLRSGKVPDNVDQYPRKNIPHHHHGPELHAKLQALLREFEEDLVSQTKEAYRRKLDMEAIEAKVQALLRASDELVSDATHRGVDREEPADFYSPMETNALGLTMTPHPTSIPAC